MRIIPIKYHTKECFMFLSFIMQCLSRHKISQDEKNFKNARQIVDYIGAFLVFYHAFSFNGLFSHNGIRISPHPPSPHGLFLHNSCSKCFYFSHSSFCGGVRGILTFVLCLQMFSTVYHYFCLKNISFY